MNKLMVVVSAIALATVAAAADVYDFKASLRLPVVTKGVRSYKTCTYKGLVTVEYSEDGGMTTVSLEADSKNAPELKFDSDSFLAVRMGKDRMKTSAVYFETDGGENFEAVQFSGEGSFVKAKKEACGPCGTTTECWKLKNASGYVTGVYNCGCEDAAPSLDVTECMQKTMENGQPSAPMRGTWSMVLNKKLSEIK